MRTSSNIRVKHGHEIHFPAQLMWVALKPAKTMSANFGFPAIWRPVCWLRQAILAVFTRFTSVAKKLPARRAALLAFPILITACAEIPRSTTTESQFETLSCAELVQQIEAADTTKVAADQAKSDSWHAVVPFVVAARYANANSAFNDAERRQKLLTARYTQLRCVA